MIEFDELKLKLGSLKKGLPELKRAMCIDDLQEELKKLEEEAANPEFWSNIELSGKNQRQTKIVSTKIKAYNDLVMQFDDAETIIDIAIESEDESLLGEATEALAKAESDLEHLRVSTLLSGEYDSCNAILTFHPGAGGTEAQDWAQMLYRMYTRWAERSGYKYKLLDWLDGDGAGIKSATILVEGENAYGYLRAEAGVHRLVRISPFDASGRRQTSFASVDVTPEIDDTIEVEIAPDDIRVDTYRASGAGGQHVNKTESAIRITHIPTGIVVACQNERSQHQNREVAMRMLKSKLIEIKEREHLSRIEDIKGVQKEIGWGSQIRSYVFMPYTLVKDNRTGFEVGNINAVMDGDLDGFINAYLRAKSEGSI